MIIQVITPVIAEGIKTNESESFEIPVPVESLESSSDELEGEGLGDNAEVETEIVEDTISKGEDNNDPENNEQERIISNEDEIDVIAEEGNNPKVDKSLEVQSENEVVYPESDDLKERNGFNYDVGLYVNGEELGVETNIKDIKEIQYLLEFKIDDKVTFTDKDYLELDISNLNKIPELNLDNLNKEKELVFNVKDENGNLIKDIVVGSYNVVDGKVIINFSNGTKLNELDEREGSLSLYFTVNNEVKVENIIDVIKLERARR